MAIYVTVEKRVFPVNKSVLMSKSKWFAEAIADYKIGEQYNIQLPNFVKAADFEKVLEFMNNGGIKSWLFRNDLPQFYQELGHVKNLASLLKVEYLETYCDFWFATFNQPPTKEDTSYHWLNFNTPPEIKRIIMQNSSNKFKIPQLKKIESYFQPTNSLSPNLATLNRDFTEAENDFPVLFSPIQHNFGLIPCYDNHEPSQFPNMQIGDETSARFLPNFVQSSNQIGPRFLLGNQHLPDMEEYEYPINFEQSGSPSVSTLLENCNPTNLSKKYLGIPNPKIMKVGPIRNRNRNTIPNPPQDHNRSKLSSPEKCSKGKDGLKQEILDEIKKNMMEKIKEELFVDNDFINDLKEELKEKIIEELKNELENDDSLKDEILEELRDELREELKEEFIAEFKN